MHTSVEDPASPRALAVRARGGGGDGLVCLTWLWCDARGTAALFAALRLDVTRRARARQLVPFGHLRAGVALPLLPLVVSSFDPLVLWSLSLASLLVLVQASRNHLVSTSSRRRLSTQACARDGATAAAADACSRRATGYSRRALHPGGGWPRRCMP